MEYSKQIRAILKDGLRFISRLKIVNKKGKLIKLTLTDEQIIMFHMLENGTDTVFGKARQIGSSTFISAYLFWKWYSSSSPINVAILSKDWDSTLHIFGMWKIFYDNLPKRLQRKLSVNNETRMKLEDTGAVVRAISSAKPGALRSYTQKYIHLSELAFTSNADEVLSNAYAALNGNQLIIESTANHPNDVMHRTITKAIRGEAELQYTFFPWTNHKEYSAETPKGFCLTRDEEEYAHIHSLSNEQMYWRRLQIEKHGFEKFRREYPISLKEAYAQTGNQYFTQYDLRYLSEIDVAPFERLILQHPIREETYGLGCDVAAGVGKDYSTIVVLNKRTYEPVALYRSNTIGPEAFARVIQEYSTLYNNALTLVESNNWGLPVLNELRHLAFAYLWKSPDGSDWNTNASSKLLIFEQLRTHLSNGVLKSMDSISANELRSFVLDKQGLAPHVPQNLSHHGDMVIAYALAIECLKSVRLPDTIPTFLKKAKANRLNSHRAGSGRRY